MTFIVVEEVLVNKLQRINVFYDIIRLECKLSPMMFIFCPQFHAWKKEMNCQWSITSQNLDRSILFRIHNSSLLSSSCSCNWFCPLDFSGCSAVMTKCLTSNVFCWHFAFFCVQFMRKAKGGREIQLTRFYSVVVKIKGLPLKKTRHKIFWKPQCFITDSLFSRMQSQLM